MGVECREWSDEQLQEYVNTLRFVITMFEDYPEKSIKEFKKIFQDCIDREIMKCH